MQCDGGAANGYDDAFSATQVRTQSHRFTIMALCSVRRWSEGPPLCAACSAMQVWRAFRNATVTGKRARSPADGPGPPKGG